MTHQAREREDTAASADRRVGGGFVDGRMLFMVILMRNQPDPQWPVGTCR